MPEQPKEQRLKEIAYHEAGHAAVACAFDIDFEYVTIIPNEKDGNAGHIKYDIEKVPLSLGPDWLRLTKVVSAAAGAVAQKKLTGKWDDAGANSDYRSIFMPLISSFENPDDRVVILDPIKPTIQNLSDVLLKNDEISYETIKQIFDILNKTWENIKIFTESKFAEPKFHSESPILQHVWNGAFEEAEEQVENHWPAIQAIAEGLLDKKTLDYEETHRVFVEAMKNAREESVSV